MLATPVLLVLGADDETLDVRHAIDVLSTTHPGSHDVVVVPGAGHMLPVESEWLDRSFAARSGVTAAPGWAVIAAIGPHSAAPGDLGSSWFRDLGQADHPDLRRNIFWPPAAPWEWAAPPAAPKRAPPGAA